MTYPRMIVTVVSLLCLTAVVLYALKLGYDGLLMALSAAIFSGIAGYEVKPLIQLLKSKKDS
ncbi:unnamed protein product [marine sediment metagenome]|uniref:Uncharacterized protein n=1 Tax=marine sediment metagenome TaxID=412755 RepID=X1QY21_9ZZZZ